jgi:ferritin-like metal-binding protein YciE
MTQQEFLVSWLKDAHGLETHLVQTLERQAKDARDYPQVQAKIQEHLEKTRHHADLVEGCLKHYDSGTSTVKSGLGSALGAVTGMASGSAKDEIIKDSLSDYAAENMEIASYTSLIAAAKALGDNETAQVCQQILQDEEEMAQWLKEHLSSLTQEFLSQNTQAQAAD